MGGLQGETSAETQGIALTRRAESIGGGISLGEDLYTVQLEVDLVWERDRPVTLPCHAPLSRCSVPRVVSPLLRNLRLLDAPTGVLLVFDCQICTRARSPLAP